VLVLTYKFILYKQKKLHYFFFDFCYFGNIITYVFIFFARDSPTIFHSVFAFTNGAMLASVLIFKNSLVLHDFDKLSSFLLHIVPAKCMWAVHWFGRHNEGILRFELPEESFSGIATYFKDFLIVYGIWLVFYYIVIFHIKKKD